MSKLSSVGPPPARSRARLAYSSGRSSRQGISSKPSSSEALDLVRALEGIDFRGFDVVEVAPVYDGPGQGTAILAANVAYAMLGLVAKSRA